jgi:hypothetical protein
MIVSSVATLPANPSTIRPWRDARISLGISMILFRLTEMSVSERVWDRGQQPSYDVLTRPALDELSVTEVAHRLGFNSSSHFSTAFSPKVLDPSFRRQAKLIPPARKLGLPRIGRRVDARAECRARVVKRVIGEGDRGSRHSRAASRPRSCIKALMRLTPAAEISLTDILHQWAA